MAALLTTLVTSSQWVLTSTSQGMIGACLIISLNLALASSLFRLVRSGRGPEALVVLLTAHLRVVST
eukprot:3297782-Pyramimonas_sp.AAC.1